MCAESYYSMLVPIICDLKPCVNYVEIWIFGQPGQGYSPGGEVIKMPITFGVKIGLMISVDLRHGQGEKHSCLLLLYSPAQVASYVTNVRDLYPLWTTSVYMYEYIRCAISNHLFFCCRLKRNHMIELQFMCLFLNLAWPITVDTSMYDPYSDISVGTHKVPQKLCFVLLVCETKRVSS